MDIVEHISLWYDWYDLYPKAVLLGLELGCFSNFLRNSHIDFPSSFASLHSYQQWRSVPFISHPFQHKFSWVFLILVIFKGIKWNLRVVLIALLCWLRMLSLSAILDSSVESSLFISVPHFYWIFCSFDDQFFFVLCIFWRPGLCPMCRWWRSFPSCRMSFFLVDYVLCFIEASQFQEVPFINCCFQCLHYWGYI